VPGHVDEADADADQVARRPEQRDDRDVVVPGVAAARPQPLHVVQLDRAQFLPDLVDAGPELDRPVGHLQVLEGPPRSRGRRLNRASAAELATRSLSARSMASWTAGPDASAALSSRSPNCSRPAWSFQLAGTPDSTMIVGEAFLNRRLRRSTGWK